MTLEVVIVNYNVKYFLRQCLSSVFGSERRLADGSELGLEVWVVDNDSVDGSVEMVRRDFPQVHLIENRENVGFARANNQALELILNSESRNSNSDSQIQNSKFKVQNSELLLLLNSESRNSNSDSQIQSSKFKVQNSELLLLLNPDTIVERDTFVRCADFIAGHPDCGGLCVKMVDGEGRYLKESKRGFPTPEASFYKVSGLVHLFPRSRRVAAYYMGHIGEDEEAEVDIMCGAYLMFRREVYEKIGGLDETYFMYGEDVDFSWRIVLAGYRNYYLPTTRIVHYKGESTRKGSISYVYNFYNAMSIFVRKYYGGRGGRLFSWLLEMAIWTRAMLAGVVRVGKRLAVPLIDFTVAVGGFVLLKHLWATLGRGDAGYYPPQYTLFVIPLYVLILMLCSWLSGGYDRPVRLGRIVRGVGVGVVLLLAFYSLLDEGQRYSRMLLLMGSVWTLLSMLLVRLGLSAAGVSGYALRARKRGRTLIVGSKGEAARVAELCREAGIPAEHLRSDSSFHAGRLQDLIRIEHVEEVVFCGADVDLQRIIALMSELHTTGVVYKIAPAEGDYIIGSGGILSRGDLYLDDLDTLGTGASRRSKRLFDIGAATFLLVFSPVLVWLQHDKRRFFKHCLQVLSGRLTWVGYTGREGVFSPADLAPEANAEMQNRLMLRYMRRYRVMTDAAILLRRWRFV